MSTPTRPPSSFRLCGTDYHRDDLVELMVNDEVGMPGWLRCRIDCIIRMINYSPVHYQVELIIIETQEKFTLQIDTTSASWPVIRKVQ